MYYCISILTYMCIMYCNIVCSMYSNEPSDCHLTLPYMKVFHIIILKVLLQMAPPMNRSELTIIILDGDVCLIKSWSDCYTWLATRIGKGDLELFVSFHNKLVSNCDFKLNTGLLSGDSHLSGESISGEIDTSCERSWKQPIE